MKLAPGFIQIVEESFRWRVGEQEFLFWARIAVPQLTGMHWFTQMKSRLKAREPRYLSPQNNGDEWEMADYNLTIF